MTRSRNLFVWQKKPTQWTTYLTRLERWEQGWALLRRGTLHPAHYFPRCSAMQDHLGLERWWNRGGGRPLRRKMFRNWRNYSKMKIPFHHWQWDALSCCCSPVLLILWLICKQLYTQDWSRKFVWTNPVGGHRLVLGTEWDWKCSLAVIGHACPCRGLEDQPGWRYQGPGWGEEKSEK